MFSAFNWQQMTSAFIVLFAVIDIIGSIPIIINNFFARVIPVYNKFLVNNIGAAVGATIITTSNSLP